MRYQVTTGAAVLLLFITAGTVRADDTPQVVYITREFYAGHSKTPPCTPLEVKKVRKASVELRGLPRNWDTILVDRKWWDQQFRGEPSHQLFASLVVCVAYADQYRGRTTPKMVSDLDDGKLTAGMPVEFAQIILGPTDTRAAVSSALDPVSHQPVVSKTYVWSSPLKGSGLRQVLDVVGTAAFGVGALAGSASTAITAFNVSTAASVASIASWSVEDLSKARMVTLQVDANDTITMLTVQ